MEADRIPGLYFTGDRTFLHLAQEIKDNIYGFCTEEINCVDLQYAYAICAQAILNKTRSLNMLLVNKQLKKEYETEQDRLDNSDGIERSLTMRYSKEKEEDERTYRLEDYLQYRRRELPGITATRLTTTRLTMVTSLTLEYYEGVCRCISGNDVYRFVTLINQLPRLKTFHVKLIVPYWMYRGPPQPDESYLQGRLNHFKRHTKSVKTRRFTVERHSYNYRPLTEPGPKEAGSQTSGEEVHVSQEPGLFSRHEQHEYTTDLENADSNLHLKTDEFVEVPCTCTMRDLLEKCPTWKLP